MKIKILCYKFVASISRLAINTLLKVAGVLLQAKLLAQPAVLDPTITLRVRAGSATALVVEQKNWAGNSQPGQEIPSLGKRNACSNSRIWNDESLINEFKI